MELNWRSGVPRSKFRNGRLILADAVAKARIRVAQLVQLWKLVGGRRFRVIQRRASVDAFIKMRKNDACRDYGFLVKPGDEATEDFEELWCERPPTPVQTIMR